MSEQAAFGQSDGALLKVFISYSRKDADFADRLADSLRAKKIDALIDRTAIYAFEDWWRRIQSLIQEADSVVFILSPDAVSSEVCGKEVDYAASLNKRLAPIQYRPTSDRDVPAALRNLNFLFFQDASIYDQSLAQLVDALTTNIEWLRSHTEFCIDALHWDAAGRPSGLLLRSPQLEQAERWISTRPGANAPAPTETTVRFIAESRRGATRRRNQVTGSLAAGLLIALGLAGVAFWQRGVAQQNAQTAAQERDHATQLRNEALVSQSKTLKTFSVQQTTSGDAASGLALTLQGLPLAADQLDRPLVPETVDALDFALRSSLQIGEYALGADEGSVVGAAYSPDGRWFAAGTNNGHVLVWDAQRNVLARRFAIDGGYFSDLSFSPDGTRIAVAGDTKVLVLNVATGKITALKTAREDQLIPTIAFGPNGKYVVGGTGSNFAVAWNAESGGAIRLYKGADPDEVETYLKDIGYASQSEIDELQARLSRANDNLSRATLQERIEFRKMLHSFAEGAFMDTFSVAGGTPYATLSRDGKYLATTGKADPEAAVRLFDVDSGKLLAALTGHGRDKPAMPPPVTITDATFDFDGDKLASAGQDNTVRVWEVPSGKQIAVFRSQTGATALDIDTDGKTLAVGYADGSVELIDIASGRRTALSGGQAGSKIAGVRFASNNRKIAAASQDGWIRTWWLPGGALSTQVLAHRGSVWGITYSPDGTQLLSYGADNAIRWWHAEDPHMHSVYAAETIAEKGFAVPVFSADGSRLVASVATTGTPEISALLDTGSGRVVRRFKLGQPTPLRADGMIGLQAFNSFAAARFDPATGALLAQNSVSPVPKDADKQLNGATIFNVDPTGRRILAGFDQQKSFRLFDAANGNLVAELGAMSNPTFSPLGNIVIGVSDQIVGVWDASAGESLGTAHLRGYTDEIRISRDGDYFALRGGDEGGAAPIELVTVRPKLAVSLLEHHRFGAKTVAISEAGRLIAVGFEDGTLGLFTRRDGAADAGYDWQIMPQGTSSPIVAMALSEQSGIVAAADDAGVIRFWNLGDQVPVVVERLPSSASQIVLSADATKAAVLDKHGDLHLVSLHGAWGDKGQVADMIAVGRALSAGETNQTAASDASSRPARPVAAPAQVVQSVSLPPQMPLAPRAAEFGDCDRLAAAPGDRDRQAAPVETDALDAASAIAACKRAVAAAPADRLSVFQLARSLEKSGAIDEARSEYREALSLGHAAAARQLALLLARDEASGAESAATMDRAIALGDPQALLAHAIELAKSQGGPDTEAALRYAVAASRKPAAQASNLIGAMLASDAADDGARARAMFFFDLGRNLAEGPQANLNFAQPPTDERAEADGGIGALMNTSRDHWHDELRDILAHVLAPRTVADAWRAARSWQP
jgi:WD40 repeat protein